MGRFDVVLTGGRVIDPASGLDRCLDVGISRGTIAALQPALDTQQAEFVVDVSGLIVCPGLVDMHAHGFFTGGNPHALAGDWSVQPDPIAFRTGVTTLVDAGSAGWRNFPIFRTTVVDRSRTRVLAFVNISGYGMIRDSSEQGDFDAERFAAVHSEHSDVVVGVKTAHYREPDWMSVDAAVAAGNLSGVPAMVDFGSFLPERPFPSLFDGRLRPGDISTHMFHPAVPWFDEDGQVLPYLRSARDRGIHFDLGHGGGGFVFRNAVPAVAGGFFPDSISTDMHGNSVVGPMMDMPNVMSKMLAVGMPLMEVLGASTYRPAEIVGRPDLGRLEIGSVADVSGFDLQQGSFAFADCRGGRLEGTQRLSCELTIRAGDIVWDRNARTAVDYRTLGPRYGLAE